MTFKKIAALFAAAALSANTLCFSAYADLPEDDFIISGGFITGYVGDGGDVVIPEGIVGIEEGAFRKNDNITNLVISENCVSLESFAFSQCSELKTVVFEGDMEKVGMMSFIGCPMLESVKFMGGCSGNTQGVSVLIKGMDAREAIKRIKGIDCNGRGTSCPDQLAKALELALEELAAQ